MIWLSMALAAPMKVQPEGAAGQKWGDAPDGANGCMTELGSPTMQSVVCFNDHYLLGGSEVKVTYRYFERALYKVVISTENYDLGDLLLTALINKYGPSPVTKMQPLLGAEIQTAVWKGASTSIEWLQQAEDTLVTYIDTKRQAARDQAEAAALTAAL